MPDDTRTRRLRGEVGGDRVKKYPHSDSYRCDECYGLKTNSMFRFCESCGKASKCIFVNDKWLCEECVKGQEK